MYNLKKDKEESLVNTKVLLTILPYWDPVIPPTGIASLKSYLQGYGYQVVAVDLIVKRECLDFYDNYFKILRSKCVPKEKWGNFNNIGHDVLQNHMMAHIKYSDVQDYDDYSKYDDLLKYIELVRELIYKSYYVNVGSCHIVKLIKLMDEYYKMIGDYFVKLVEQEKPDVVGATVYKCTLPSTLFVLKLTKEKFPHIKTIIGGGTFNDTHAVDSPNFNHLLNESKEYIDKIFIGQGEKLLLKYLRNELDGTKRIYTLKDINFEIADFKELNTPDYSDFDTSKYPYLAATASVGCVYNCSFCTSYKLNQGKYRIKDYEQTVLEMSTMYKKYRHQLFFMTDSLLNPVATGLAKEMIKQKQSFYYDAYFKVDDASANIENTLFWRKGGLYRVRLGTESGSQKVLDSINKGITKEQIKATLSALAYAGIKTTTYWVIGHPGETEEDFQETLDLIDELRNVIFQAECNPFLYHYSQQSYADQWSTYRKHLYPMDMADKLVFESYTLELEPLREIAYERMHRFVAHCAKLRVPNPYSYNEHADADKRWKRLHQNAVPPLSEFLKRKNYITENHDIKVATFTQSAGILNDDSFNF